MGSIPIQVWKSSPVKNRFLSVIASFLFLPFLLHPFSSFLPSCILLLLALPLAFFLFLPFTFVHPSCGQVVTRCVLLAQVPGSIPDRKVSLLTQARLQAQSGVSGFLQRSITTMLYLGQSVTCAFLGFIPRQHRRHLAASRLAVKPGRVTEPGYRASSLRCPGTGDQKPADRTDRPPGSSYVARGFARAREEG